MVCKLHSKYRKDKNVILYNFVLEAFYLSIEKTTTSLFFLFFLMTGLLVSNLM